MLFQFFSSSANEDTPQLYMLCGRGPRSTVRVLRHGLEVSEMAVSELPGNPNAVWTVKRRVDGEHLLFTSGFKLIVLFDFEDFGNLYN